jgi:hypothetical protein
LRPYKRTSFHHQPEAQHLKSSAIHKLPADYPIFSRRHNRRVVPLWRAISLTRYEARRIAANVAELRGLLAAATTASGTAAKGETTER